MHFSSQPPLFLSEPGVLGYCGVLGCSLLDTLVPRYLPKADKLEVTAWYLGFDSECPCQFEQETWSAAEGFRIENDWGRLFASRYARSSLLEVTAYGCARSSLPAEGRQARRVSLVLGFDSECPCQFE